MKTSTADSGICAGFIMPHPPVLIPAVGKGREADAMPTLKACRLVASRIATLKPETIVFISPHAPLFGDYLFMYDAPVLTGTFARFGAHAVSISCQQDSGFVHALKALLSDAKIPAGTPERNVLSRLDIDGSLDHGVLVPLHFIREAYENFRIVCISSSAFETDRVLEIGKLIREATVKTERRICIVASGDLSHRVTAESPYGMVKEGSVFDKAIADAIAGGRLADILSISPDLREAAAECGYNSFAMLAGALGDSACETRLYSEEAPFGIGYCVAGFELAQTGANAGEKSESRPATVHSGENASSIPSWPVALATTTIEHYVKTGETLRSDGHSVHGIPRAGCFVSIKKHGELRGCIGTIAPATESIEEEIIRNAVSACSEDPRFEPVEEDELAGLTVSVDILSAPEPVESRDTLDPSRYGVIVTSGFRRGLLLPDLEGVDTVETQLSIACRKGGIDPEGQFRIERFTVTRYH